MNDVDVTEGVEPHGREKHGDIPPCAGSKVPLGQRLCVAESSLHTEQLERGGVVEDC